MEALGYVFLVCLMLFATVGLWLVGLVAVINAVMGW